MSLKNLFFIFGKDDVEKELKIKLHTLEKEVQELKLSLSGIQNQKPQEVKITQNEPPIIIERINIEKIILDKYELNNNFGQLGIKELKGKLNIGATYGSDFTPFQEEEEQEVKEERNDKQEKVKATAEKGPKINIKSKPEN
ncbi:MAG: hypothetical protein Q8934_09990 [Bacillota bacterium]|nr:hypothetical protein [Bacillota bacterium]